MTINSISTAAIVNTSFDKSTPKIANQNPQNLDKASPKLAGVQTTRAIDKATPGIRETVASGGRIDQVDLNVAMRGSSNRDEYFTHTLENARIGGVDLQDSYEPGQTEEISFNYDDTSMRLSASSGTYDSSGKKK